VVHFTHREGYAAHAIYTLVEKPTPIQQNTTDVLYITRQKAQHFPRTLKNREMVLKDVAYQESYNK